MPGKPGHGQGKHLARSKRRKGKREFPAVVAQKQAASPAGESAIASRVYSPVSSKPATAVRSKFTKYPHVLAELRRIGILGGIMVAILIVLALVLS